ncbi:MAG: flagellar basal body rod protein FlgB [Bdellovibrionota bacterium]
MKLFNNTFDVLQRAMDLRAERHGILTSNIANSETPGFHAQEVDFSGELQKALGQPTEELSKTSPMHMDLTSASGAHIVPDTSAPMGADGNNVDLDIEMGKLGENSREYANAATWLGVQLRLLKTAARGRVGG